MNTDFRISTTFFTHYKTRKLKKRLGLKGVMALLQLWAFVAQEKSDGNLSGMSTEDIELVVDWRGKAGTFVSAILECNFLEGTENNFVLHNWLEKNPWVAGSSVRQDAARFSRLAFVNPEAHQLLLQNGIKNISKEDYEQIKISNNFKEIVNRILVNQNLTQKTDLTTVNEPLTTGQRTVNESLTTVLTPVPVPDPNPIKKNTNTPLTPTSGGSEVVVEQNSLSHEICENSQTNDTTLRANGNNPRATETNPRATGKNPRKQKAELKSAEMFEAIQDYTDDCDLVQALQDFVTMRKEIKKELTLLGLKKTFNDLDKLAGRDTQMKIAILNQSIQRSWQGVFKLPEEILVTKPVSNNYKSSKTENMEDLAEFSLFLRNRKNQQTQTMEADNGNSRHNFSTNSTNVRALPTGGEEESTEIIDVGMAGAF